MKILVTGGAGFIGSHLCKELLDQGHNIICLDNLYTGQKRNLKELENYKNFTFINADIRDNIKTDGLDQIYNLACPASPPAYQKDPVFTFETSVLGIINILKLSIANGNIPILQASTSEVYGDPDIHPQPESYWGHVNPIGIRSCYDEGKRAAETTLMDYYRKYNLPIRVIRIFNTYGPNMDPKDGRVVSNFINQAISNQDITIYGDGSQTRSFQYVSDLIKGMILMMNNESNFIGPVNIGNPAEFTVKELAEIVLKLIPESKSKIVYKELPSDDPKVRQPDITLANRELDWKPVVNLKDGLKETIKYFRSI